jgi:hypothetical protein
MYENERSLQGEEPVRDEEMEQKYLNTECQGDQAPEKLI